MTEGGSSPGPYVLQRALALADDREARGRDDEAALLYRQVLDADPRQARAADGLAATSPGRSLPRRLVAPYARRAVEELAQRPRIWKYRMLSTCPRLQGRPRIVQPVLFVGPGEVVLGDDVQFGWRTSPLFYAGYCHVEAAGLSSRIEIGDRAEFNNNLMLKSEGPGISVGRDGLFGAHVEIVDSNFHDLDAARRVGGTPRMAPVTVEDNVFVGMSVKILKGVTIGRDSVIGAGAVVTKDIPAGVIAGGNPAKVIAEL